MSADPIPSTSSASRTCKSCGGSLTPDAPGGNCPACLWELASAPPEEGWEGGGLRIGSYVLLEEVARGGMGAVWRARHEGLGREVALKLILGDRLATTEQVLRFLT